MDWNYKAEESTFEAIPEGRYRAAIEDVEKTTSKAGNDMLKIKLLVSGTNNRRIWYHIVFLPDRPEITNKMLTAFFDSFGIDRGDFNLTGYVGKVGGIQVRHDDDGRANVQYCLSQSQQRSLPAWDGETVAPLTVGADEDDLPF